MKTIIVLMILAGSALMVYNIYGFVRFARFIKKQKTWGNNNRLLYLPIVLLVLFLIGYLVVGLFGNPDIIMAGILFGGSIFVFVMYRMLSGITVRILENERLEADLLASERSSQEKSEFLATISHEMRTPLNVILGMHKKALNQPDLPETVREPLQKIGYSANHLLSMINNILDMQQIESGMFVVKEEPFSMKDSMNQINAIAGTLSENKGLTFSTSLCDETNGTYLGDASHLRQVLLSILDNAVKYTEAPGTVTFAVTCEPSDTDTVKFSFRIEDTGIGMSEEFLPKLFDVFAREDTSTTNKYSGSGLSLVVAKNMVNQMNGTITVESEKGKGSVFTVTVPLKRFETAEPADEKQEGVLAGHRVLIVEDILENAEIVADLLSLEEVETEHAENGQIALEMFEQSPEHYYDAILMDLRMPVMDGLEATRRIRALDRDDAKKIPIIALTANAFDSDIRQSFDAGMNAHMAKPTDADLLYAELRKVF